jgi:hypothetical protein
VQVDYLAKTLFQPLLDGIARTIEVKERAEDDFVASIDKELSGTVFSAGCSNWYINAEGRNSASWPGYAANFWYRTLFPKWNDFELQGGSSLWVLKRSYRVLTGFLFSKLTLLCSVAACALWANDINLLQKAQELIATVAH